METFLTTVVDLNEISFPVVYSCQPFVQNSNIVLFYEVRILPGQCGWNTQDRNLSGQFVYPPPPYQDDSKYDIFRDEMDTQAQTLHCALILWVVRI
jgi:hypothetical protein